MPKGIRIGNVVQYTNEAGNTLFQAKVNYKGQFYGSMSCSSRLSARAHNLGLRLDECQYWP